MATAGIGRQSRLCVLLVKVGTPVARAVFEKRVKDLTPPEHHPPPWTVDQFLSANKQKIRSLKLPYQTWAKIFPVQSHMVKLEHWDLTLLCSILIECCDLRQDTRLDIKQLRKLRNKFFHMSEPSIDDYKYQHYLAKLKVIFDRCLKEINDDAFTNEMSKMFEDLEHGHFSQVDLEEVMKQLKFMEGQTKEKLTELGRNQQFTNEGIKEIIQRLEVIETVAKDLKSHTTQAAAGVEIAVKNCSTAKEKEISERLVQYFEEFIRDDVEFPKLPESCQQNIRVAVFKAYQLFLSKDYKVVKAEEKCVFLTFNFTSLVSLISFLRECVTGELSIQLQEIEAAVRMLDECEDVTLEAVMNTEGILATLHEIELSISSSMETGNIPSKWASSTDKNADVKIREVRLLRRNSEDSSDATNGLQVSFENMSNEYTQRLKESFEKGEIDTAMQRIQEAVASEFQTTGISITAQLIQENKTVKQEYQNMPLTKTSPSVKVKSTECSSTKGREPPSERKSAGNEICFEPETCNDSKTRAPVYTHHPKSLKTTTVNRGTAAKYTPHKRAASKGYVDNALNRRHGRVGLPTGSFEVYRETNLVSQQIYIDNTVNRKLRRVGKPIEKDETDLNQTAESLSMRLMQLENALVEAKILQEHTEAERAVTQLRLDETEKTIKDFEDKQVEMAEEMRLLKSERRDTVDLKRQNSELVDRVEILMLENKSLKELIRDKFPL